MGGHGRALEVLHEVLQRHRDSSIEPVRLVNEVMDKLAQAYDSLFSSDLFNDASICQEVLAGVLSRRKFLLPTSFGQPGWTPDKLCSLGLFRYTEYANSRLECAFVLLVKLLQRLVKKFNEECATFDKNLESAYLLHEPFEDFVAIFRRVKSIAFFGSFVPLIELHNGARFGRGVIGLSIEEQRPREIVIAKGQQNSSDLSKETNTSTVHDVDINLMHSIVINTPNAPAGNIVSTISTPHGHTSVRCNEIILCKSTQIKCNMDEETYNTERQKTDLDNSDVFLLITPEESREFELPPQCGIVSKAEFQEYFGLFASRAEHCLEQL
ncbi:hypothetical protein AeRB84_002122 [Aphanomyces euteiches]|nr:hypothetical protein AeRB84_002122 [Aphanomyces euteiches]